MFTSIYRTIFIVTIISLFLWLGWQNFLREDELFLEWYPKKENNFIDGLYPEERATFVLDENNEYYAKIWYEPIYFFVPFSKPFNKAEVNLIYQSNLDINIGLMYSRRFPIDWRFDLKPLASQPIEGSSWSSGKIEFKINSDFLNIRNKLKGLEFMISSPELYQKGENIKLKKIEILLKNE